MRMHNMPRAPASKRTRKSPSAKKRKAVKRPKKNKSTRAPPRGRQFVYILQSKAAPTRTYVGVTNDIHRRLRQHNGHLSGGAQYTKAHRPWFMNSLFELPSRREALSLEWKIKHQKRRSDGAGVHGRISAAQRLLAQFPVHRRVF